MSSESNYQLPDASKERLAQLVAIRDGLKPKEVQVLDYVFADGLLNKAIAKRMGCSERSIEGYRATIVEKFGAETMNQVGVMYGEWRTLMLLNLTTVTEKEPTAE